MFSPGVLPSATVTGCNLKVRFSKGRKTKARAKTTAGERSFAQLSLSRPKPPPTKTCELLPFDYDITGHAHQGFPPLKPGLVRVVAA